MSAASDAGAQSPSFPPFDNSVLFIIADDLGIEQVKFYSDVTSNNPAVEHAPPAGWPSTPNIELKLRPYAIRFTNGTATPYCSSTRSEIQSGRFGMRTGIGKAIPENGVSNSIYPRRADGTHASLAKLVKQVPGYVASWWGKVHIMGGAPTGPLGDAIAQAIVDPTKFMYDWLSGHLMVLNMSHVCPGSTGWPRYVGEDVNKPPPSTPIQLASSPNFYHCDVLSEAETWIQGQNQKFVAWFAPLAPFDFYYNPPNADLFCNNCETVFHTNPPNLPAPAAPGLTQPQKEACYRANIEAFDTMVGRLIDLLENRSMQAPYYRHWYETTTIVLIGDNGSPNDVNFFWNAGAVKGTVHEGGIRVPFLIAGKAVTPTKHGSSEGMLVHTADLYPTVASIVGAPAPTGIDGVDLYLVLQGAFMTREWVYSETIDPLFDPTTVPGGNAYGLTPTATWKRTATDGRWKVMLQANAPFSNVPGAAWNPTYWEIKYTDSSSDPPNKLVEVAVPLQPQHTNLINHIMSL